MNIQCHCGQVSVLLPELPRKLNRCSCSICRRYGALWSYYPANCITVSGTTDAYIWGDRMIVFHRCQICGVLTHWSHNSDASGDIGINMQNADPNALADIFEYDGHERSD